MLVMDYCVMFEQLNCVRCLCVYAEVILLFFFFFKQKTAYEMRISDWSSDVCSSDLMDQIYTDALTAGVLKTDTYLVLEKPVEREDLPEEKIGRASCRERVCQYV